MFLYTFIAALSAASLDFVNIEKGANAPFSGKLISHDALAGMIATHESELQSLTAEKDYELQKQFEELTLKYELYEIKCSANEEMYKQMIDFRDKEINAHARKDWIQRLSFYGGFALGAVTTVGIAYSVNQN